MTAPKSHSRILTIIFGIVLLLVGLMTWLSLSTANTLNRQSTEVANQLLPQIEAVAKLQKALTYRQHRLHLFFLNNEHMNAETTNGELQRNIDAQMTAVSQVLNEPSLIDDLNFEVSQSHKTISAIVDLVRHQQNSGITDVKYSLKLSKLLKQAQLQVDNIIAKLDSQQFSGFAKTGDHTQYALTEVAHLTYLLVLFSLAIVVVSVFALKLAQARQGDRDKLYQTAYIDPLTGLNNHQVLQQRLDQLQQGTLLIMKTDRLPRIANTYGHYVAEQVALQLSNWLAKKIEHGDDKPELFRYYDDGWAVLYPTTQKDRGRLLDALAQLDKEPFVIDDHQITITLKAGVTQFPQDGLGAEQLLRNADTAIMAIAEKRSSYNLFTPALTEHAQQWLAIESGLHQAITKNELALYYQAKVDTQNGELVGAEALLRWFHNGLMVSPGQFIPVAEDSGLIVPIGNWVIEQACRQLAYWRSQGLTLVPIAVNISAQQFQQSNFFDIVNNTLASYQLNPELIELEITEQVAAMDPQLVISTMQRLKQAGFQLAIDDFGTGYSSLSYLQRLPVDSIKIDRSFISQINLNGDNAAIVDMILTLANQKNLVVVAEGVETEDELHVLRRKSCHQVQGFLFAKPEPATEFTQRLVASSTLD